MTSELEEIRQRKMNEMMNQTGSSKPAVNGWPETAVEVSDKGFEEFVRKYPKVVVDCWAPWCGPCRMLSPTIEQLAKDYRGRIVFGKLNTDDNYATASKFKIVSIPTLLFFKDGKLVNKTVGAAPRSTIEAEMKKSLG